MTTRMYEGTGERVREARRRAAITQVELAGRAGLSADSVVKIETGHHSPRPTTLRKLAAALGVEVGELMEAPPEVLQRPRKPRGTPRERRVQMSRPDAAAEAASAMRGEWSE